MAISFIGSQSVGASNGGNVAVDITSLSPQTGDLIIAAFTTADISDQDMLRARTAGFTLVTELFANDTNDVNLGVYARFYDSTLAQIGDVIEFTGAGSGTVGDALVVSVFRGVDMGSPFDVPVVTATGIDTANADAPAITPSSAGAWTVIALGSGHGAGAGQTYTFPSGYTTNAAFVVGPDTADSIAGIAYNSSPGSPENPGLVTVSSDSTNYCWAAVTMALRPLQTSGIRVVGTATGEATNGGAVTITLPTMQQDDLVIVSASNAYTLDLDVQMSTAGYTEVADLFGSDTVQTNQGVFYKFMGASPDATAVVAAMGDTNDGNAATAVVFRGVDTTTPMDVAATTATGNNGGRPDPASIDYTAPNAFIVIAVATGLNISYYGYIFRGYYLGVSEDCNDTRRGRAGMAYAPAYLLSDPENPAALGITSDIFGSLVPMDDGTWSWTAVTMALKPAATLPGQGDNVIVVNATSF